MKNLLGLLSDPGPAFTPGALDVVLTGSKSGVQEVLLQKRDGTFYVALWLASSSWDPNTLAFTPVAPQAVTVSVSAFITSAVVHVFDAAGALGSAPAALKNGALSLTLDDHVTLVELKQ